MELATKLMAGILEEALEGIDETEVEVCRDVLRRASLKLQK